MIFHLVRLIGFFAASAVLTTGCGPARRADVGSSTSVGVAVGETDAAARAAILATSREFSARYERGDAAGMVALYTSDGVILPPGVPALRGPDALLRYWTLAPGRRVLEHRVTPDSIVIAGSVAYDWGVYYARTQDAAGAAGETRGKYVIVWRETIPGTWRIHIDMWNSGPRAGTPAPRSP